MVLAIVSSEPRQPRLRALPGGATGTRPKPALDETALLEGVARGDERIAVEFYHRLRPTVEASLLRVLGRRESDHEDLIQVSFEQIVKTLSTKSYAGACSLKTWASTIAANVALKSLRSRIRRRRVLAPSIEPSVVEQRDSQAPSAEQTLAARRKLDELRCQLARISPHKAQAVLLHDVLGHGLTEVAAMTGCSVSAAQTRLSRGRRELSKLLTDNRGGEQ